MSLILVGNWWGFVLRGIAAIIFGLLTFFMPGMALLTLIYLFGFYAIVEGVFNIIAAARRSAATQEPWWPVLLGGIVSIIAGVLAFVIPGITALALLYIIAAWAVVNGILAIAAAIRLRKVITGEWLLALIGALSVIFGLVLVMAPGAGALALVWWIGAYAIILGALLISLGLRLRSLLRHHTTEHGDLPPGDVGNITGALSTGAPGILEKGSVS